MSSFFTGFGKSSTRKLFCRFEHLVPEICPCSRLLQFSVHSYYRLHMEPLQTHGYIFHNQLACLSCFLPSIKKWSKIPWYSATNIWKYIFFWCQPWMPPCFLKIFSKHQLTGLLSLDLAEALCLLIFHSIKHCSQTSLSICWACVGNKYHDINKMFIHQGDWS